MYGARVRTSVCRGTVIGSCRSTRPPSSRRTGSGSSASSHRSAKGAESAALPRDLFLAHHVADRAPRSPARADAPDRVGDDSSSSRPSTCSAASRAARSPTARSRSRTAGRTARSGLRTCTCRRRTQACYAAQCRDSDRRLRGEHRRQPDLEERPRARGHDVTTIERLRKGVGVASIGDTHFLPGRGRSWSASRRRPTSLTSARPGAPFGENEPPGKAGDADPDRHGASVGCAT